MSATEIVALFKLYKDQVTIDYDAFKLQKERVIMLSHLSQQQAADNLELNLRMVKIAQFNEIQLNGRRSWEQDFTENCRSWESNNIKNTLIDHHTIMRNSLREMTDSIKPYDVEDMKRFMSVQNKALKDSELRMFLSFMPIRYREHVSKLKAESSILYV
jgi:hypothetical protein